jgi:hypothetical protein
VRLILIHGPIQSAIATARSFTVNAAWSDYLSAIANAPLLAVALAATIIPIDALIRDNNPLAAAR